MQIFILQNSSLDFPQDSLPDPNGLYTMTFNILVQNFVRLGPFAFSNIACITFSSV